MNATGWVNATSSLIHAQSLIVGRRQWRFFEMLKEMVQRGDVCFPKEVKNELQEGKHVDTPEAGRSMYGARCGARHRPSIASRVS